MYIRREVKLKVKDESVDGIAAIWRTVDVAKCTKYIRHLREALPKVIEFDGAATAKLLRAHKSLSLVCVH